MTAPAPLFDGTQPCSGADLALFFPAYGSNVHKAIRQAKEICARCPFIDPCREYAITHRATGKNWLSGVWGGTTDNERARIRKQRRTAA